MTDEAKALVERLRWGAWYYEDPFDGKAYASDDPLEAADRIEALEAENERLCGILEQWLNTAREHLDTEVAGRTFEALRKNSHD